MSSIRALVSRAWRRVRAALLTATGAAATPGAMPLSLHERRVHHTLRMGSALLVLICLPWGVFFTLQHNWPVVVMDAVGITLGLAALGLERHGKARQATLLLLALVYAFVVFSAVFIDVPSSAVPRSGHAFLIGLAMVATLLLRTERPWLRLGLPLLMLLTYIVLGSSNFDPETTLALPDSVRTGGVWINNAFAVLLILLALTVLMADVAESHGLAAELHQALDRGELLLHYQPQVGRDGRVIGAEALLRWQHPQRGMVSPGEFIPVAEQCGLMPALGDWVLREACQRLALWRHRPATATLTLAVNVSAAQLVQPDFVDQVRRRVAQAGLEASRLKLELTESVLVHDLDDVMAKMAELKTGGIGFALDDFGTGFSSLSYLRRLPLDQLKIDQSFVRHMLESPHDAAIAQTIISLGGTLGLEVIAEGVETEEQRHFLAGIGCDAYQGYLYSRPLPVDEFEALVSHGASLRPHVAQLPLAEPAVAA